MQFFNSNRYVRLVVISLLTLTGAEAQGIPSESEFSVSESFPATAAFGWAGGALPDGRYVIWNGDTVFVQRELGKGILDPVASGYTGDPGFLIVRPSGTEVFLGGGFNGNLYSLDLNNPLDFTSGTETSIGRHFAGVLLTPTLMAIDRGDFGFPAEVVVLDVSGARSGPPVSVLSRPEPTANARTQVVEKPSGSFSASLGLDAVNNLLYVTDSGNGQIKTFDVADIINAFNTATPLDWNTDGTDFGTPFQFPLGGVSGFTTAGNAVMAGFGGIVEVDPLGPSVVQTLDIAGTGTAFYTIIFNDVTEDLIVFQDDFPNPSIVHTTASGLPALPFHWSVAVALLFGIALLGVRRIRRTLGEASG